jgi:hypothetical protein
MTAENVVTKVTLEAAADLSSHQYRYMKIDSNGKAALVTSANDVVIGILQNAPESGQEASIALLGTGGISKVVLAATIATVGAIAAVEYVGASDNGKAQVAVSGQHPAGIFVGIGDEDDIGSVILTSVTAKA